MPIQAPYKKPKIGLKKIIPLHKATSDLLDGLSGIELGPGVQNPFGLNAINVTPNRPVDRLHKAVEKMLCGTCSKIDLIGHAAAIPVEDNSQDFVFSSHVLEHAPDLLRAFLEGNRVIRSGGYFAFIFPLPDAVPADTRPISTIAEAWKAYKENWTWGDGNPYLDHYWKFDCLTMSRLIKSLCTVKRGWPGLNWVPVGYENPDQKVGNGFWLAYKIKK